MAIRVASRFLDKVAEQAAGARNQARRNAIPINKPKGIDKSLQKEQGEVIAPDLDETTTPHRRDIQPKDVFAPTPNNTGVRNFAETGKDLSKALEKQVPKDKGYDTVRNLSQYLIRTDGGGGTPPQGK